MTHPLILLLGKNGQVGWELRRTLAPLGRILALDYPEIDLTEPIALRRIVLENRPAVVVNAAAYTAVDKAESDTPSPPYSSTPRLRVSSPRPRRKSARSWFITRQTMSMTAPGLRPTLKLIPLIH